MPENSAILRRSFPVYVHQAYSLLTLLPAVGNEFAMLLLGSGRSARGLYCMKSLLRRVCNMGNIAALIVTGGNPLEAAYLVV